MLRVLFIFLISAAGLFAADIKTVHFQSLDNKTKLTAYVFEAVGNGRHPAIVMLHGRAGPYSSLAKGSYTAATLSKRHKEWGEFWSQHGYVAILVDSFAPRGFPEGFSKGSYDERPPEVSEQTVRPLDAYAGLRYLRGRKDVQGDRIGVQGWSNGGMTVLVTMGEQAPGLMQPGFRAALAEYPGCGMDAVKGRYKMYAPLLMILASEDKEVSPERCQQFAKRAKEGGSELQVVVELGAEHNFDDPGKTKQSNPANHKATEDVFRRAEAFFAKNLK